MRLCLCLFSEMTSDHTNHHYVVTNMMNDESVVDSSLFVQYKYEEHRPLAIIIPSLSSSLTSTSTDEAGNNSNSITESTSNDSMDGGGTRSSFLSSNTANLIYASTLQMNDISDIRIPLCRTKTPRTPQSIRSHSRSGSFTGMTISRRHTRSPVDEICLGPKQQSPSQYLMNRYKANTPKSSDFSI